MAFKPETIKLKKWDEVHDYAKPGWIFRGERKVKRDPKTTLERACNRLAIRKTRRGVEERLFREFRRNYHHYSTHVPKLETVLEWLSLMQHHGAPTRLLDFTYSIYIAAYFATEANDKDCAIWALDSRWALRRAASLLRKGKKCDQALDQMMKPFQEGDEKAVKPLFSEKPYVCAAWPINAFRLNQRLRIQQGVFLIPGDVEKPFVDNLAALMVGDPESKGKLLKIVISRKVGREAVKRLFSMGISRTSLFPGLDGYARSLNVWHPEYDPIPWTV